MHNINVYMLMRIKYLVDAYPAIGSERDSNPWKRGRKRIWRREKKNANFIYFAL